MAKQPAFQFYTGDWKRENGIQALSYEEKGIWLEMLIIMFDSGEGKLVFPNGNPMQSEVVARMLNLDNQTYNQTLTKFLEFGLAEVEPDTNIIFNRRMVRDAKLSKIRKDCGKLGGNPRLVNQNATKSQPKRNQKPTPSTSSSIYKKIHKKNFWGCSGIEEFSERIKSIWGESCASLPQLTTLTEGRLKALNSRLSDIGASEDDWHDKLKSFFCRVEASNFLTDRFNSNREGWKANFDWVLKPANFAKILEGNYDNRHSENEKGGNNEKNKSNRDKGTYNDGSDGYEQLD